MGIVSFSIPQKLITSIIANCNIPNFVETGTYKGNSSIWASKHFSKVYTIEIDETLSKYAAARPDAGKNIEFIVGDSKKEMPKLAAKLSGRTLFWLDGHWCMGAGGKDDECPLMSELEAITSLQDSIILVDDVRCFLGPLPPPHMASDWPRIDTIFQFIRQNFPNHHTTIIDDVLVIYPSDIKPYVDKYWQETYNNRFSVKGQLEKMSKIKMVRYLLGLY
ncbi:MAG: hypothetical protein K0R82_1713 [Flavipsychrobacter sp.]|nr:hypothetical protein [Flavipsychrobacter sp.]